MPTWACSRCSERSTFPLQLLKFSGCYHGHADSFLVQAGSGVATLGLPDSPGVPAASTGELAATEIEVYSSALLQVVWLQDVQSCILPWQRSCNLLLYKLLAADVSPCLLDQTACVADIVQFAADTCQLFSAAATLTARYNDLDSVRAVFKENKDQIAGIILEPVVGNSGYIAPTQEFLQVSHSERGRCESLRLAGNGFLWVRMQQTVPVVPLSIAKPVEGISVRFLQFLSRVLSSHLCMADQSSSSLRIEFRCCCGHSLQDQEVYNISCPAAKAALRVCGQHEGSEGHCSSLVRVVDPHLPPPNVCRLSQQAQ